MKNRFRLIRRGERHQFYCVDTETGHRTSLKTSDRDAAEQIVLAKNQALRQPSLNLQIAKAYQVVFVAPDAAARRPYLSESPPLERNGMMAGFRESGQNPSQQAVESSAGVSD